MERKEELTFCPLVNWVSFRASQAGVRVFPVNFNLVLVVDHHNVAKRVEKSAYVSNSCHVEYTWGLRVASPIVVDHSTHRFAYVTVPGPQL